MVTLLLTLVSSLVVVQATQLNDLKTNLSSQNSSDTYTDGRSIVSVHALSNDNNSQQQQQTATHLNSARSGRMLDLNKMTGEVSEFKETIPIGGRQSRKLSSSNEPNSRTAASVIEERSNKKLGKKMTINGFIPIVSLTDGNSKDSKQLGVPTGRDEQYLADSSDEQNENSEPDHLRDQIASSFGAQTSMGHASFGPAPTSPQQQPQQYAHDSQWQQSQVEQQQQIMGEQLGRARKLLAGGLFNGGHRQGLRPLSNGLVSNLIQRPTNYQQHQLADPTNLPAWSQNQNHFALQASQQQQAPLVALGAATNSIEHCICVPFFQCKNGFLTESQLSKSQLGQLGEALGFHGHNPRSLGQQHQLSSPTQPNDKQMVNDIYEQLKKSIESQNLERELLQQQQQLALIDERNANGAQNSSVAEGEARGLLGLQAQRQQHRRQGLAGGRQCGIMRICCRAPPAHNSMIAAAQQQHAARLVQTAPNVPYQLMTPTGAAVAKPQWAAESVEFGAEQQQNFMSAAPNHQLAANELYQKQQIRAQPIGAGSQQFMAGRCGQRQTLGIAGRVQNCPATAHGEQSNAEFGEFPAHAAILRRLSPGDSLFVCSAVLVSSQWLATAAHCLRKLRADEIKVRLGEWDVSRDDEFYPHIEMNVRELILHPEFQSASLANDIALIRLDNSIGLSDQMAHISPACLTTKQQFGNEQYPSNAFQQQQQHCWLAGWGKDAFGTTGNFQTVLRKVDLPVVGHHECEHALRVNTKLGPMFRLHSGNICAGGESGKDACEGDGGAGLYCIDPASGLSKVVGLVSWGVGCGQRGVPGVYVNMAHYAPWIEQVISASGEENLYPSAFDGRHQTSIIGGGSDPFRSIISERSNHLQSNNQTSGNMLESESPSNTSTTSTPANQ